MTARTPRQSELPLGPGEAQEPPQAREEPNRRDWTLPPDYGEGLDIPAPGGVPEWLRIPLIDD